MKSLDKTLYYKDVLCNKLTPTKTTDKIVAISKAEFILEQ